MKHQNDVFKARTCKLFMKSISKRNGVFDFLYVLPTAPHREELNLLFILFPQFHSFSAPDYGNESWMFVCSLLWEKKRSIMFTRPQFLFRPNKYAAGVFRPEEISFCVFCLFSFLVWIRDNVTCMHTNQIIIIHS